MTTVEMLGVVLGSPVVVVFLFVVIVINSDNGGW